MAVNFTTQIYNPTFAVFARPVTFTPKASQPGQPNYVGRGIYTTQLTDIPVEGTAIFSDQVTILDIIDSEFTVVPIQNDEIFIPATGDLPALGGFKVLDTDINGGGETTLTLQKLVVSKP